MAKSIELARQPETIYIKPSTGLTALNLRDLWIYRELVYFMIWRDIKVRYKQTVLGAAWAIIQPVLTMLIFNFIFGSVAKVPTDGIPYPIFSYTALLPWGLFSAALNNASRSLTTNVSMVTKIYFPRLVLPLASVLGNLVDFAIAFIILIVMMIYYKVTPTAAIWTLPLFIILSIVAALGVSLWLAAINVQYRDVNYVLPFLTSILDVHYAGGVFIQSDFAQMAARLFAQPDGRSGQWFSLGAARHTDRTQFAIAGFGGRYSACFGYRPILLPLYGADVCGYDLT